MKAILKRSATLMMAFFLAFVASAQTASEVLAKASQKINSAKSITAKFSGSTSGTLISSGNKFSLEAGGFGIWYNGTDMWTYSRSAGETSLTTPTQSELLESNPMEIIKSYQKQFTAEKVSANGNKYTIKLTPTNKTNNVKSATLVINTSTYLPESIDMMFTNNNRMVINITSITEGQSLGASQFDYPKSKYPGIEVVDLR